MMIERKCFSKILAKIFTRRKPLPKPTQNAPLPVGSNATTVGTDGPSRLQVELIMLLRSTRHETREESVIFQAHDTLLVVVFQVRAVVVHDDTLAPSAPQPPVSREPGLTIQTVLDLAR